MEKELNLGNQIAKYYKSFSGTDTLAFILMPGSSPVVIGSLTTISYSMYRNKKPVINIGRTNINGVTRGSRIFAGTMIFTLINQHWLKELQTQLKWLEGFDELKVDELPLFDVMIVSANEYGNASIMFIYGIDFTDEAQTISVEDLFTENTFSFVARDISNFKSFKNNITASSKRSTDSRNDYSQKFYVLDSSSIDLDNLAELEKELSLSKITQSTQETKQHTLTRNLYYSTSKTMTGNDVVEIQELLNKTKLMPPLVVNGIFDKATDTAVRKYQSIINDDNIDGIVNEKLYNNLINHTSENDKIMGVVVNKHNAYVYRQPNFNSDVVDIKQYNEQLVIYEVVTDESNEANANSQKWYKVNSGYIEEKDLYSSYYTGNTVEFPTIKYGDYGAYVTLIQSILSEIYPEYQNITGFYDYDTQKLIKTLQENNGLDDSGIVDYGTWLLLQSLSGSVSTQIHNDNFKIDFNTLPGVYNVSNQEVLSEIETFDVQMSCDNYINVKLSAICFYEDNATEVFTKTTTVKELQTVSLKENFRNAFVYNPTYGNPKQIDYIIYPYNKNAYKWTIMYS